MNASDLSAPAVAFFAGPEGQRERWSAALEAAARAEGLALRLESDPACDRDAVDYVLFAPNGPKIDLRGFANLRAILSLWAGVEQALARPDLPEGVPLTRMVEPGLEQGMIDYVAGHVLRVHLDLDGTLARHRARRWDAVHPPLSSDRRVGVLGLGALGMAAARALRGIGFRVSGWSRGPKTAADGLPEGVESLAGMAALDAFLEGAEILVVLLPLTEETRGLLSATRLARLPEGAHVINAARGPILPEAALLAALGPADAPERGRLGGATLDVFEQEPLAQDHPYWAHPKILVTPHIASVTRPETASLEIVRQIARDRRGQELRHRVARGRGY